MGPIAPSFLSFEPPLRVLLTRMLANSNVGFVHPARERSFEENRVFEGVFSNPFPRNGIDF